MQEKENIIRILKESLIALKEGNSLSLKRLSEQTNHTATIYQDPDNVIVAVLVYSFGKIIERDKYNSMDGWDSFIKESLIHLKQAIESLEKNDLESFRNNLGLIRVSINKIEGNLKIYLNDVLYKAGVNKAFKFYEHGLSSQKTAELLGVSLWDLSSYIGQSNIAESRISESLPVKKRIEIAEEFFK